MSDFHKEIVCTGISRNPSDRMTADGAAAESLNVYMENNETAPMLAPDDVTTDLHLPTSNTSDEPVFLHKTTGYCNTMTLDNAGVIRYYTADGSGIVFTLEPGEEYLGCVAVGNTLIITTSDHMHYVKYTDGKYEYLGTKVPVPNVEFWDVPVPMVDKDAYMAADPRETALGGFGDKLLATIAADEMDARDYLWLGMDGNKPWNSNTSDYKVTDSKLLKAMESLWENINIAQAQNHAHGILNNPIYYRVALRLYDGSFYACSVPVMLGANAEQEEEGRRDLFTAKVYSEFSEAGGIIHAGGFFGGLSMNLAYKVKASFEDIATQYGNWKDIVESVCLFCTEPINLPADRTACLLYGQRRDGDKIYADVLLDPATVTNANRLRERLDSFGVYYLLKEWKMADFAEISSSAITLDVDYRTDTLAVNEKLTEDYGGQHELQGRNAYVYNTRLVLSNLQQELASGYPYLNAPSTTPAPGYGVEFTDQYCFILSGDAGEQLVVHSPAIRPGFHENNYVTPYGYISYPDPRCRAVIVKRTMGGVDAYRRYEMEESATTNTAFCFIGFNKVFGKDGGREVTASEWLEENKVEDKGNSVAMSEPSNPFLFPATGRINFDGTVMGVATTTKALSTGQFGEFPLYVFTSEGIWAVALNATGGFASNHPLSREVVLSSNAITPIDQAIVFVTKRGVSVLSGSDTQGISDNMLGKHYSLPLTETETLAGTKWEFARGILADETPFMEYVETSRCTYDYAGKRLIFFQRDAWYAYVYKLDTQSWHKMCIQQDIVGKLNSYPDAYLVTRKDGCISVQDVSTVLDVSSTTQAALPGLIVTRALDFQQQDAYKTITDIKVRGDVDPYDVRWALMASNDGRRYHYVHSRRGPSFKTFRLLMLTDMAPEERLSYVEMAGNYKFINRVR